MTENNIGTKIKSGGFSRPSKTNKLYTFCEKIVIVYIYNHAKNQYTKSYLTKKNKRLRRPYDDPLMRMRK